MSAFALLTVPALGLGALGLAVAWLRWAFLVRRHGVRIPTRDGLRIFLVTLPAALTPLYAGELARACLVWRRSPRAAAVMGGVWAAERLGDAGALLALWGLAAGRAGPLLAGGALLAVGPWLLGRSSRWWPRAEPESGAALSDAAVVAVGGALSLLRWVLPAAGALLLLRAGAPGDPAQHLALFARMVLRGGFAATSDVGALAAATPGVIALLGAVQLGFPALLGVALAWRWRAPLAQLLRSRAADQCHFDALAPSYAEQIPEYLRERLLSRKLGAMLCRLPRPGARAAVRGLDLGCGQGWYLARLAQAGYAMSGVDASAGQIAGARRHCVALGVAAELGVSSGVILPFPSGSFDFVYSINVFHHLIEPRAQARMFAEVLRVLAPGGSFFLHEINVENPIFRLYMSYLFPLLKRIDEGTELWLRPTRLPELAGGEWLPDTEYFTFLPDFLPAAALRVLAPLERWLERSRWRRFSAHYMSTLRAAGGAELLGRVAAS